jgi:hypothetical protein
MDVKVRAGMDFPKIVDQKDNDKPQKTYDSSINEYRVYAHFDHLLKSWLRYDLIDYCCYYTEKKIGCQGDH